jgi:hypothetical protein
LIYILILHMKDYVRPIFTVSLLRLAATFEEH